MHSFAMEFEYDYLQQRPMHLFLSCFCAALNVSFETADATTVVVADHCARKFSSKSTAERSWNHSSKSQREKAVVRSLIFDLAAARSAAGAWSFAHATQRAFTTASALHDTLSHPERCPYSNR
jgi:hypothetical protein